jgi:hypothetical protein
MLVVVAGCGSDSPTEPSRLDISGSLPSGWIKAGGNVATYVVGTDRATVHSGRVAVAMAGTDSSSTFFTGFAQSVQAAQFRGKRVRFSGWVRGQNLTGAPTGLWMRVDGDLQTDAFDNSATHSEHGTTDWHQVQVILDVPVDAVGISYGALMVGSGVLVVDDLKLEVIPATGPTTDQYTGPQPTTFDAVAAYMNVRTSPFNLDFESN